KDLATILLDDVKANGRRIKKKHAPLEHARDFFGDGHLARNITTDRLTAFVAQRQEEKAANATINRSLAALRRAFNLAKRAGRVVDVPYFPMLREDNAREGFLEQGQFLALRAELPDDLKGIVTFLWLTGWRVGEALTLGWDSVYADAIRLKATNSKNKHGRELPLVGELKEVIAHARASRTLDCPTVFSRDGKPIKSFVAAWRTACKDAGLGAVRVHDLRRSAARNLIRAGVPENIAMHFTGHKTSSVFRRYDIVTADDLAQASSRLETHLAGQPATAKVEPIRNAQFRVRGLTKSV